jgi:hypothetical protein
MRGRLAPLGALGSGDAAMTLPTEAERLARLHKRAGCDCTEEAMNLIELARHEQGSIFCPGHGALIKDLADEVERLRAAVEAERYRTLQEMVEGITVERGHCSVCDRVVAAIRARGRTPSVPTQQKENET